MKKLVSVFGPSESKPSDAEYEQALELGRLLARSGFAIVTGGFSGVMEAVSRGAREEQGTVIGVTAEVYLARGREPNEFITRQVKVKSAVDALMELIDIADAYVAIGNSTGTLIEVMFAWDYMIKRFIPRKPLLLIGETWSNFKDYVSAEAHLAETMWLFEYHSSPTSAAQKLEEIFGPNLRLPDLNILQSTPD